MKYLFWLLAIFTIISCDPGYAYYVSNNTEKDIYVITKPPIKIYDKNIYGRELDSAIIKPKISAKIRNFLLEVQTNEYSSFYKGFLERFHSEPSKAK